MSANGLYMYIFRPNCLMRVKKQFRLNIKINTLADSLFVLAQRNTTSCMLIACPGMVPCTPGNANAAMPWHCRRPQCIAVHCRPVHSLPSIAVRGGRHCSPLPSIAISIAVYCPLSSSGRQRHREKDRKGLHESASYPRS